MIEGSGRPKNMWIRIQIRIRNTDNFKTLLCAGAGEYWAEQEVPVQQGAWLSDHHLLLRGVRPSPTPIHPVLRIRIRDPVPFRPLDPGSGIGFSRISDPGSRIPNPYFWELCDNFLGKKFYNFFKIGPIFFSKINKMKKFTILWNLWLQKRYDN